MLEPDVGGHRGDADDVPTTGGELRFIPQDEPLGYGHAVFCANDLGGAWDGDPLGGYTYPCTPGGERQRELSFRMGVNLVLYALTGNYKKDQVHIPFILKRRQR